MLEQIERWLEQRQPDDFGDFAPADWLLQAIEEGAPLSTIEFGPCDVAEAWAFTQRYGRG